MAPWVPAPRPTSHLPGPVRILDAKGRLLRTVVPVLDEILCARHHVRGCPQCAQSARLRRRPVEYLPMMDGIDAYGDRAKVRSRGREPEESGDD